MEGGGGGRRRGLKEKIKEKLLGEHKDKDGKDMTTTHSTGNKAGQHHQNKGMGEKIKEKLKDNSILLLKNTKNMKDRWE